MTSLGLVLSQSHRQSVCPHLGDSVSRNNWLAVATASGVNGLRRSRWLLDNLFGPTV
jgi:hypothetical protein